MLYPSKELVLKQKGKLRERKKMGDVVRLIYRLPSIHQVLEKLGMSAQAFIKALGRPGNQKFVV